MEYFLYAVCFLFVWTVASVVWFFEQFGTTSRDEPWWNYVLLFPILTIAWIMDKLNGV